MIFATCFNPCNSPPKSESWDQENLKKNDHGCPTAIFVAPGGELKQVKDSRERLQLLIYYLDRAELLR